MSLVRLIFVIDFKRIFSYNLFNISKYLKVNCSYILFIFLSRYELDYLKVIIYEYRCTIINVL